MVKIYTRTGDSGETGLFGGGRVGKDALRVEAYGSVDELNASLGLVRAHGVSAEIEALLSRIQKELFDLGADLATPTDSSAREDSIKRMDAAATTALEAEIDRFEEGLEPLQTFILPGGCPAGAALHLSRTIARRAERRTVTLARTETISEPVVPYLNRLSDLLFVLARAVNAQANRSEEKWLP